MPQSAVSRKSHWAVGAPFVLPLLPLGAVAAIIALMNLLSIFTGLRSPDPISPWEGGIVTEAWRMLQGESVYDLAPRHATHMYGPLITVTLAGIFRFTGLTLQAGRVVELISGLVVILLAAKVATSGYGRGAFILGAVLLLGVNGRSMDYFTETRPDLTAFAFSAIALTVLYRGLETEPQPRLSLVMLGSALFIAAALFKQTAAGFTVVPVFAVMGRCTGSQWRKRLLVACTPLAAVILAFAVIWKFAPNIWFYIVSSFMRYPIYRRQIPGIAVELILTVPLFLLAFAHWLATDAAATWKLPRVRWLLAAIMATIPISITAWAKYGGSSNSVIPALLSLGAFCAWRSRAARQLLSQPGRPLPVRTVLGSLLAVAFFLQCYPHSEFLATVKGNPRKYDRTKVIAEVRSMPGKVVCPDDPTIPLFAKGYAGRSAILEGDLVHQNYALMPLDREIGSADWVIVRRPGLLAYGLLLSISDDFLRNHGFELSAFQTTNTPAYALWRRTGSTRGAAR